MIGFKNQNLLNSINEQIFRENKTREPISNIEIMNLLILA